MRCFEHIDARGAAGRPFRATLAAIGSRPRRPLHGLPLAAALLVLASPPSAHADVGATIIERCTHGQSIAGFSQQDYERALQELPKEVEEYSNCGSLIRQAQLSGNALLVTVKLSQKGTVRISGTGLRTTIKKNLAAGSHRIRVPLTKSGVAARQHRRKLIVHVTLTVASAASWPRACACNGPRA